MVMELLYEIRTRALDESECSVAIMGCKLEKRRSKVLANWGTMSKDINGQG